MKDRSQHIGSSDIAAILNISPWKSAFMLWQEKTGKVVPEDISELFHVQRGIINEPVALALVEDKLALHFESNKRFTEGAFTAEADGYRPDMVVEIKCMGKDAHYSAERGIIPVYYRAQCQWIMMLTNTPLCVFASFRPEDNTLHTVEIKADAKEQKRLVKEATKFWDLVTTLEEPPLSDLDYADMSADAEFKQLAEAYRTLSARKKEAEDTLVDIKKELGKLLETKNITRARGCGLVLNKYERRGNVDYAKIPELKGVDLEQYRKGTIKVFDVRHGKVEE
jgi:putative phage-type endonuclease